MFLILTLMGLFLLRKLPVKLNPSAGLPSIQVNFTWMGATPYNMEREVTARLEAGFSTIRGLSSIRSKSSATQGTITLSFDKHTSMDAARFEVATIIRQLYKKLPEQVSYPQVIMNRPDGEDRELAFLSYSIDAPLPALDILSYVRNEMEPSINAIAGVDRTIVYGAPQKEFLIRYKEQLLTQLFISREEIIACLQQQFAKEQLGRVLFQRQPVTLSIQSSDRGFEEIPIKKVNGRIFYLKDIATIEESEQEAQNYYRVNGKNAVTLTISATKTANTILLAEKIDAEIQQIKLKLPKEFTVTQTYNATDFLTSELKKIYERTSYTTLILLTFIALLSWSWKYLVVTILSLAANLGGAFLFYYLLGVEIQLYSLAGITISLGLILDNSIVMIDHWRKHANRTVFLPILAATLTTVGALSVIYFLDDKYKVNLVDFAMVIIINLSVSLFTALFLIPALMEKLRFGRKEYDHASLDPMPNRFFQTYKWLITRSLTYKKGLIISAILAFGIPLFLLPAKFKEPDNFWENAYNTSLGSDLYQEKIRPYLDKILGGSFRLFKKYVFENALYSKNEEIKLLVSASMEKGASVQQMNETFLELENFLQQFPEIKRYVSIIYSGDFAFLEITFHPTFQQSAFPYTLKARLVRKVLDMGGINWSISGVGNAFNSSNRSEEAVDFSVIAKGYNYEDLNRWADSLRVKLLKHPRIKKVIIRENSFLLSAPAKEIRLELDAEQIALQKKSPSKVFALLRSNTLSKQPDLSLHINGNYLPVRLESDNARKFDIWALKNMPLDSFQHPVILNRNARIYQERAEENIIKENQEYTRLIEFQYTGARKFGSILLDEILSEMRARLPLGYRFEHPDSILFFARDKQNNYLLLLVLVFLIIYFICAILFESFKKPLIIISLIPISFIGVFLTFYLFRFDFDQGGLASFVLLSGITVNASIFLLNSFNTLQKEFPNTPSLELYLLAFRQKYFPILLTIISTILGFIPFIKDGQNEVFWFALGVGTIGGLLFSVLGILFYLPLFTLKKIPR